MKPGVRFILRSTVLATAVLAGVGCRPVAARDQDEAREAVEAGEIRPLTEILNVVGRKLGGDIVRVHLERNGRQWVYEFRVVDKTGRLFEIHVDARSGEVEQTKEK